MKNKERKSDWVRNFVLTGIRTGEFAPGKRIPTERELCEKLEVSRITVRSGLLSLVQESILTRRSGSGTFVNSDRSRTGTIAFFRCMHSQKAHEMRNDFVYSEILEGIQMELHASGVDLISSYIREEPTDTAQVLEDISAKADGFIFGEMRSESFFGSVTRASRPVVLINPEFADYSTDAIDYDNLAGTAGAMEYLIGIGHRSIGFINGRMPTRHAVERLNGYRMALERYEIVFDSALVAGGRDWQSETGSAAAVELLEKNRDITAVFAANDALAIGAIKGLRDAGLRVPQDVSVMGFDDMIIASYSDPALTTMRVDRHAMGRAAANRLLQLIRSPTEPTAKTLFVPKLVVRESCEPR